MGRFIKEAPFDEERRRLTAAGENWKICRWCGVELTGRRSSWCSQEHSNEFAIRISASTARWMVRERDKGVCAVCGVDTLKIWRYGKRLWNDVYRHHNPKRINGVSFDDCLRARCGLNPLYRGLAPVAEHVVDFYRRIEHEMRWEMAIKSHRKMEALRTWRRWLTFMEARRWTRTRLDSISSGPSEPWDADHIDTVHDGGGGCGLENYQTLCLPCHKAKNAEHAKLRARARDAQTEISLV